MKTIPVVLSILVALSMSEAAMAATLRSHGRAPGPRSAANSPGVNSQVITVDERDWFGASGSKSVWTESAVAVDSSYGQGKVDAVLDESGLLWSVFFDDRNVPVDEGAYFLRRSADGGTTWQSPFANNGFFLTYDAGDDPSIAVRIISPGQTRICVGVTGARNGYWNTYCVYKDAGDGSWTSAVVQNATEDFRMPRLLFAGNRLVAATTSQYDGNYYTDLSTTNGATWTAYSAVSQAINGFSYITQPDLSYHSATGRLFCAFSASRPSSDGPYYDENRLHCLLALSVDQGTTWKRGTAGGDDVGPISVGSTSVYSYERVAVETSQGLAGAAGSWLILTPQQITSTSDYDIGFVYGLFANLAVYSVHWTPGTVYPYTLADDASGEEAEVSLFAEAGLTGRYHACWVDEQPLATDEVRYSSCAFSDVATWTQLEEVSAAVGADPNVHFELGQGAASVILAANSGSDGIQPVVLWTDSRNVTVDVYSAKRSLSGPTATPSATPTAAPSATPTATATPVPSVTVSPTPAPIPSTSTSGVIILAVALSLLLARRSAMR